jgi:hypothetical protein
MAGRKRKNGSWPRCGEATWRGPCPTASVEADGGPCQHHLDNPVVEVEEPLEEPTEISLRDETLNGAPVADDAHIAERVDNLRAQLAKDIGDEYALLRDSLLEGLKALRETWATCRKCGTRTQVVVPDMGSRVRAVEALLNQTAGRPGEESKRVDGISRRAHEILAEIEGMTDEELEAATRDMTMLDLAEVIAAQEADPARIP